MSRVFEALSKASADKNRQAEMVPKPVPLEVFSGIPQVNGNGPSPARRGESSAKFHDNLVAVVTADFCAFTCVKVLARTDRGVVFWLGFISLRKLPDRRTG